ncbi:uncharacterized protein LOC129291475 isoform X1 [Prosopis cineraria]|uniref:uncharacterized protein LOC129291475 isoform X1 n=1 Tax=Prosopis cineraria TaxID=364024 RepID=UPI00240FBE6C|nr:uncharacterized protein LOC129291475 isoform X1 [Prosopis cineraria]XP_054784817.1 uncharacterized protein LOC129291475 isoform X1 [Prosopis cineraria]XP_054784820.1 uncharacterized protein LOC129291475 isoform X1 [Prosopis cineraria]XP_054784821.1 uncharacterized protein LOC129291475 isoform X1 [Prosopis cineraria]
MAERLLEKVRLDLREQLAPLEIKTFSKMCNKLRIVFRRNNLEALEIRRRRATTIRVRATEENRVGVRGPTRAHLPLLLLLALLVTKHAVSVGGFILVIVGFVTSTRSLVILLDSAIRTRTRVMIKDLQCQHECMPFSSWRLLTILTLSEEKSHEWRVEESLRHSDIGPLSPLDIFF